MLKSITARLLIPTSVLLIAYFGAVAVVLDRAFYNSMNSATEERLNLQLMVLLAAIDFENDTVQFDQELAQTRFIHPGSGLFAEIGDASGQLQWRSPSAVGFKKTVLMSQAAGKRAFSEIETESGPSLKVLNYGIEWFSSDDQSTPKRWTFAVAEDDSPQQQALSAFRRQLLTWFLLITVALLLGMVALMRRITRPLRRLEGEVDELEHGQRQQLDTHLPRELVGVAKNINRLVVSERQRVQRYRDNLQDLSHGLKTPLAAIQAELSKIDQSSVAENIAEMTARMDSLISHRLKQARAKAERDVQSYEAIDVGDIATRLRDSLLKIYHQRHIDCQVNTAQVVTLHAAREDIMEIVGNLMDNAFKWARQQVMVDIEKQLIDGRNVLKIVVSDDGPGIAPADRARVLQRGQRLDEKQPGHGVGLAVVKELVGVYGGVLDLNVAKAGGLQATVVLPAD